MNKLKNDLKGTKYGRLKVLCRTKNKQRHAAWICVCDCGNMLVVRGLNLKSGITNSCGCLQRDSSCWERKDYKQPSKSREAIAFNAAQQRCQNPKHISYKNYGGREIKFLIPSYRDLIATIGKKPTDRHQLDRIDTSKNYTLDNVQWSTHKQNRRNCRNTVYLTIDGVTKPRAEWLDLLGATAPNYKTLESRKQKGWTDYECLYGRLTKNGVPRKKQIRNNSKAAQPHINPDIETIRGTEQTNQPLSRQEHE